MKQQFSHDQMEPMDLDEFWAIIEATYIALLNGLGKTNGEGSARHDDFLTRELVHLSTEVICSFFLRADELMNDCLASLREFDNLMNDCLPALGPESYADTVLRAYLGDHQGHASWLIYLGREIHKRAVENPASVVCTLVDFRVRDLFHSATPRKVANDVYKGRTGESLVAHETLL